MCASSLCQSEEASTGSGHAQPAAAAAGTARGSSGGDVPAGGVGPAGASPTAAGPALPVDSEGKACRLRLLSTAVPHMRSFHLAWLSHFSAVFATFAAAPLLPVIRDDLDLTKAQVSAAGIAAVAGTVVSRVLMGGICDRWGPRYGASALLLLTASATFGMALIEGAAGFLLARLLIGFSLATFVACQFWCSVMFNAKIVGTANAVAAGWGNTAGGVVQLVMPLLLEGLARVQPDFIAWRACYLVVGWLQVLVGGMVLAWGQDMPGGNYRDLRGRGDMIRPSMGRQYWAALKNYRTSVLCIVYGAGFGVELTMYNVFSQYLFDQFEISLTRAGALASVFGFCNFFSRPAGGMLSDRAARRFGMRGRLWVLFLLQTTAAAFCCGLSQMGASLGGTMAMAACMAVTVTAASGSAFGLVPFISRRGLGAVNGVVGSGGSLGSILLQALYFTGSSVDWEQGFLRMGLTSLGVTCLLFTMRFPMWGGMLPWPARLRRRSGMGDAHNVAGTNDVHEEEEGEEEYYSRDFTAEERRLGLHASVLKFAVESKSQRGSRRMVRPLKGICPANGAAADAGVQAQAEAGGAEAKLAAGGCCRAVAAAAGQPGGMPVEVWVEEDKHRRTNGGEHPSSCVSQS